MCMYSVRLSNFVLLGSRNYGSLIYFPFPLRVISFKSILNILCIIKGCSQPNNKVCSIKHRAQQLSSISKLALQIRKKVTILKIY